MLGKEHAILYCDVVDRSRREGIWKLILSDGVLEYSAVKVDYFDGKPTNHQLMLVLDLLSEEGWELVAQRGNSEEYILRRVKQE